jgi:hypothetical protein
MLRQYPLSKMYDAQKYSSLTALTDGDFGGSTIWK